VPYHIRAQIDNEIRCSFWYNFTFDGPQCTKIEHLKDKLDKADLRVMAFDIETTKSPLKFPDVRFDQVMMISYIVDGCGFLITNREVVGADVKDFEYAPKPEFDVGTFTVFNEKDEEGLLRKFFEQIRETKPFVFTTFNGDYFDWPFVQQRAETYDLKMEDEIGVFNFAAGEYTGRFAAHMDCLYWVKRDAYLPQGSHGLKKVTKAKLGYDPVELDPELMVPYAKDKPQELAEYSVSDSVATYFLYMKMIHDFIFALCTIIPTYPDEVLRRGSGTLCENLLMAQAFRGNIIFPNKQQEDSEKFIKGQMIESETYIGGHVECLRTGVYRSDFEYKFKLEAAGYQGLMDKVDDIMKFALEIECGGIDPSEATNYEEVKQEIVEKLAAIKQRCPNLEDKPLIYHVDVAAMYPNIILSNRL
jgi:DNA polymerase epsilon subunit 1